jgi:GxxExxY protein
MKKPSREIAGVMRGLREAAKQVMASLGKGHSERVYHRALITLLNKKGVAHRSEVLTPIYFLGEVVGVGRCDLVIKNLVIELKAGNRCPVNFSPQLRKYMINMGATEHRRFHGIIINFNQRSGIVEMHRDCPPAKKMPVKAVAGARGSRKRA